MDNPPALFDNFLRTAEDVIFYFDDKTERDKVLEDLSNVVERNCFHMNKLKHLKDLIRSFTNDMEDADPEEVMKMFKKKKIELEKYCPDISNDPNLKKYHCQIKDIIDNADNTQNNHLNDDDIIMTQVEVNIIDPFTKQRMTDPVKNSICGHVYENKSIRSLLEQNKNTRCPVVGCTDKNPVLAENLLSDIVTRRYLEQNPVG